MLTPTHPCPIEGCRANLRFETLMCRTHWRRVPTPLRAAVYEAWNGGHPLECYLAVRQQAIAAVDGGNTRKV